MEILFYSLFGLSTGINVVFALKNLERKEVQKTTTPFDWRLSISNNLPIFLKAKEKEFSLTNCMREIPSYIANSPKAMRAFRKKYPLYVTKNKQNEN